LGSSVVLPQRPPINYTMPELLLVWRGLVADRGLDRFATNNPLQTHVPLSRDTAQRRSLRARAGARPYARAVTEKF
jgi:hypothetical protein